MEKIDILEIPSNGGRTELGAAEKWLFDKEDEIVRIKDIMTMPENLAVVAKLEEFGKYGSRATTTNGLAISINRVFLVGKLNCKAFGRKYDVIIKRTTEFNEDEYGKAEKRDMGSNHKKILERKIAEVLS